MMPLLQCQVEETSAMQCMQHLSCTSLSVLHTCTNGSRLSPKQPAQPPSPIPHPSLQVASGMLALHQRPLQPIIHGDLKSSNVMISDDGSAVLVDFGLSKVLTLTHTMTSAVAATCR
jgi:serine/threonine protein kinase